MEACPEQCLLYTSILVHLLSFIKNNKIIILFYSHRLRLSNTSLKLELWCLVVAGWMDRVHVCWWEGLVASKTAMAHSKIVGIGWNKMYLVDNAESKNVTKGKGCEINTESCMDDGVWANLTLTIEWIYKNVKLSICHFECSQVIINHILKEWNKKPGSNWLTMHRKVAQHGHQLIWSCFDLTWNVYYLISLKSTFDELTALN